MLTQAPPLTCSIALSDLTPGLDWVSLKVTTPGQNCSFTLIALDSGEDGSKCGRTGGDHLGGLQDQERVGVFTCLMDHLEAGTSYQLQIRSETDQHVENITTATSKFPPPALVLLSSSPSWPPRLSEVSCSSG